MIIHDDNMDQKPIKTKTTTTFDLNKPIDRNMSLPETTMEGNNPEMNECNPWELQGTRISPEMKQKMVDHFGERKLPVLTNTKATDRSAQVILDLDRDVRNVRRANLAWFYLKLDGTNIGDVGIEALARAFVQKVLARAFVQTTQPNPELALSYIKALDDKTAVGLANAINTNPSWVTLWIEKCNFGSRGVKAMVGALSNNHAWQTFELVETNLEDEEVEVLARALQQNTQWTNFKLDLVQFSSVNGVKALCEALSENKTWK